MLSLYRTEPRRKLFFGALALALLFATIGTAAWAMQQRDPAYAAARSQGQVGEKTDGYLGFVTPPSPAIKALVDDLNIRRRAIYTERAVAQNATVEQYAFTSACTLIAQTIAGERYQGPDGSWLTRGEGPAVRDPLCPPLPPVAN